MPLPVSVNSHNSPLVLAVHVTCQSVSAVAAMLSNAAALLKPDYSVYRAGGRFRCLNRT